MPIAEDSAGGSPVPIPTNLTTNLTGEATGSGTLDYTTGDIDIAVTVVDNGHNHILENITDVQVNNAISGQILVYNGTVWANATNTAGITALVQDTSPQLGGNLNLNNRNITGTGNIAITGTIDGRDVSADGTKLDGIESGATADQTAAQIKTAYESNANTNNFADADVSKLSGIQPGATADQTAAQIKTAYESNADTNAFTDADHTKLDGIETAADVTDTTNVVASLTAGTNVTIAADGTISATGGTSGIAHVVDDTTPELGGNLSLNSHDITGTGNLNFTGSVTLSGTVDGRDVAADGTKLDGIEASADVTDTANVTAAGALMDSEVTNLAQVKAFDSSDYATAAQGTTADAALPKTGGTMTGDILFNDSVKAKYGTSSDLQIFHDGSDSYIKDSGTGILFLRSNQLKIQSDDGLETYGVFTDNGSVQLYHNNVERLVTTSTGVDVTGIVEITSNTDISMDASASGQLYINGSGYGFGIALDADAANIYTNSASRDLVFGVNETEVARVKPAGLDVTGNVNATSSGGSTLTLENSITSISANELIGGIDFKGNDTSEDGNEVLAFIRANALDTTPDSCIRFGTLQNNGGVDDVVTERMRLDNYGRLGIGTTSPSVKLQTTVANSSTEAIRITNDTDAVRTHMFPAEIQAHNSNLTLNANDGGFATVIKAAGAERMRINSTGVGIGTTSPNHELHIESTSPTIRLVDTDGNNTLDIGQSGSACYVDFDNTVRFRNLANVERLRIDTGGIDVTGAIDVATSGASNSSKGLAIATSGTNFESDGGIISIDHAASGAVTGGYFSKYSAGGTLRHSIKGDGKGYFAGGIDVTGKISMFDTGGTQLKIGYNSTYFWEIGREASNGRLGFFETSAGTSSGEHMTILPSGNVGIGTASPSAKVEAFGTDASIIVHNSFNSRGGIGALSGGRVGLVTTSINDDLVFGYSGSPISSGSFVERMRIDNGTGNVSIPSGDLNVTGGASITSDLSVGFATATGGGSIVSHVQSSSTPALITVSGSSLLRTHISFENANGQVGKINTAGTQTFYVTSSDYRLKTDIQPMQGSIDRVKALNPCNFEWVNDGGRVDGFIAHEVQDVVPEAIVGEKDAMRDQEYVESEATGDIYTLAVKATYETIQVELTPAVEAVYETVTVEISPAVEATYDEDGNELTPAIEAVTEEQEQLVTPAVDATYEEQQQELTPAIDEVIHSSDVVKPDELEEGQLWRETTEKVMATRQVPDYQGIDQSKIVPLLTSALQDAIAKIEALETRLTALES